MRGAPILMAGFEPSRVMLGMYPQLAPSFRYALSKRTHNARSETVAEEVAYAGAWKRRQLCLVPASDFFEFNYETGVSIRWRTRRADMTPFAIAGIWDMRRDPFFFDAHGQRERSSIDESVRQA